MDVGRAWQGPLGLASKGAIRRLETESLSQVRGGLRNWQCLSGGGVAGWPKPIREGSTGPAFHAKLAKSPSS